jgi:hypothetical protein
LKFLANVLRQGKEINIRIRKNKAIIVRTFIFVCPLPTSLMETEPTCPTTGLGSQSDLESRRTLEP